MISISEGPTRLRLKGELRDLKLLLQKLRYRPTGYFFSPRFKAWKLTDGAEGWDGFVSPITITRQYEDEAEAICLRGHKEAVIRIARQNDLPVDTRGCIQSPFHSLTVDDLPDDLIQADYSLDQYQRESIVHWLKNGMGVNKISVNGGKTAMFAAAAAMIKRRYPEDRVLYVTQSERLVKQAYTELRKFLPGLDITQYGGSQKNNTGKDVVIATVAMLWTNVRELKKLGWFDDFIAILYDESHHVCSDTSSKLLDIMPSYFRLGASDTQKENKTLDQIKIRGMLGPIRFTVPAGVYIDLGRSAKPTIYIVEVPEWRNRFRKLPYNAEPGTPAWALIGNQWKKGTYLGPVLERDEDGRIKMRRKKELDTETVYESEMITSRGATRIIKSAKWDEIEVPITLDGFHLLKFPDDNAEYEVESTYCLLERVNDRALIRFKDRNELIVAWAKYYSQDCKYPTLVVCTRTLHIYILENLIKKTVGEDRVQVLIGEHSTKERDRAFEWFRHTPGSVLISPLVQEGVSINEIRGGVIADYVGDWERANQLIGRFIRKKKETNEAHITWFFENQHPILRKGSKEVLHRLSDIRGYTFAHPVSTPDTIKWATVYKDLSETSGSPQNVK